MFQLAKIVKVWGPYAERQFSNLLSWSFSGLREDGKNCGWTLRFHFADRKWEVRAVKTDKSQAYAKAMAREMDLFDPAVIAAHAPLNGKVTDILVACLKPEHIAKATAAAIRYGR